MSFAVFSFKKVVIVRMNLLAFFLVCGFLLKALQVAAGRLGRLIRAPEGAAQPVSAHHRDHPEHPEFE